VRSVRTVVPITEFRRDAAQIIREMIASGTPVYVTQNGRAAAVLLPRVEYEGLLHRLAIHASAASRAVDPSTPAEAQNPGPAVSASAEGRATARSGGPYRGSSGNRWQLVESRYGLVDPETADFLEAEGFGIESAPVDGGAIADVGGVAGDVGGVAADEVDRRR